MKSKIQMRRAKHMIAICSIIQHKWVYGLRTDYAIKYGLEAYFGKGLKFRPKRPVLKGIK
ncbi:hypothetical protein [Klebsiella phage phiKp_21]|nr:hypothetical protein [Klebsiella phage phiKp_21]